MRGQLGSVHLFIKPIVLTPKGPIPIRAIFATNITLDARFLGAVEIPDGNVVLGKTVNRMGELKNRHRKM
jgi:hypothetical protein